MSEIQSLDCGCTNAESSRVSEIYYHLAEAQAPLAMAYVPYQQWESTYDLCTALQVGTVFPCLHKPFCGKGGSCR